jgi:hypothetical protein
MGRARFLDEMEGYGGQEIESGIFWSGVARIWEELGEG